MAALANSPDGAADSARLAAQDARTRAGRDAAAHVPPSGTHIPYTNHQWLRAGQPLRKELIGALMMSRPLRTGDRVRVRPAGEILASLDGQGRLDGLPFMPEMLVFCGQEFTVYRRADKVCDTVNANGAFRRMRHTVHLAGVRCSGAAHGGCQAACLVHWKEAWLEPADRAAWRSTRRGAATPRQAIAAATAETLVAATRKSPADDGAIRYVCQATEMLGASEPMSSFNPAQYLRDIRSGNATIRDVAATIVRGLADHYQTWSKTTLPQWMLIRGGRPLHDLGGMLTATPRDQLHLQPGERVRVKTPGEIAATLDTRQRNRGLYFFGGMIADCGTQAQVRSRVSRIIDEGSGRMLELTNDCVTLEGKVCHYRSCPRASYKLWREIWLTRIDGESTW